MKLIELNISRIREICRRYRIRSLAVFGSILTDRFSDRSDVDLLVDFEDDVNHDNYTDNYFGLHDDLRTLLGREIDLVDNKAVSNRYFREELDETKQLIYG
ncbi:MAG: nucleotidyltransferase domain-containing protein [Muribaculaceae bacterium]|nr:nucleotidyltransferase domain-containing protein [Muribaculaceae bacterium]